MVTRYLLYTLVFTLVYTLVALCTILSILVSAIIDNEVATDGVVVDTDNSTTTPCHVDTTLSPTP